MTERTVSGPEAELLVRTGDINNLGYGWPPNFTPFSGDSTPPHPYPCTPRPGAPAGTDRIMLGSGVTGADIKNGGGDGYAGCSKRPDNLPQPISIYVGDLPQTIHAVLFQMFLDDFQAPVWKSHFQVTLNGTLLPNFGDTINQMDQTGPIGKLVTLRLLPEYWPLLRSGTVSLLIDDPTTHKLDGYAVDFVRILVNPRPFQYIVAIHCTVTDADTGKPIAGASLAAAQMNASAGSDGKATLRGIPAGLVSVNADAIGYDSAVQLVDLKAGSVGEATFVLHRHRENVSAAQQALDLSGTVAIYGIHFDTASARLRADSASSLQTILQLIKNHPKAHWIISGHTDNQGSAAYNLNLSDERAQSVVAWLVQHGVAKEVLVAKGYGLTRPVADNSTEGGRALNRRVEVTIIK
ncbi:MAG TPA: OmpA family protein [Candidatus Eremiobacteraceae bacterium]|nr:OmpA family protein [Candidatus Eremiobacteraceae bacterium]